MVLADVAPELARFAFDSYALKQAQEIFLRTAAIGNKRGERMIHALPPFNTPAEFKIACQEWIEGKDDAEKSKTRRNLRFL